MSVPSQLKAAMLGAIGGGVSAAIVVFALGSWITGNAADTVAAPSIDAAALGEFGPTYDTLFAPPDYPTLLSPNPAPTGPPSAQSSSLAVIRT